MNLINDPWIPVITEDQRYLTISVRQLLKGNQPYTDLVVLPHERIAVMRFLSCLAHAIVDGPLKRDKFDDTKQTLIAKTNAYLDKWQDRFGLFDERHPFLQIAALKGESIGASKLDIILCSGNNSTLFEHGANDPASRFIEPAKLAINLLTYQCFSPSGLIGVVTWNETETSKSSSGSICTPGRMYHSYVRRGNLLNTLIVNLVQKDRYEDRYKTLEWGHPVWEKFPTGLEDAEAVKNATESYLGRLVPLKRYIRLMPEGDKAILGEGLPYKGFEAFREATSTVVMSRKDNKKYVLGAKEGKQIWRDLAGLLTKKDRAGDVGQALTLHSLNKEGDSARVDVWVGALITDKAKFIDLVESVYSFSSNFLNEMNLEEYESQVELSERVSGLLSYAVETFRREIDPDLPNRFKKNKSAKGVFNSKATQLFWSNLEPKASFLIDYATGSQDEEQKKTVRGKLKGDLWHWFLLDTALEAYLSLCGGESPRHIKAVSSGYGLLRGEIIKLLKEKQYFTEVKNDDK